MVQKIKNFSSDGKLREEIFSLVQPSYIDPTSLIEREFANNDTIYLIRDETNQLVAFFMTGDDNFDGINLTYMGLSAVRHEYKNSGVGKQVYLAQLEDSLILQKELKSNIICWATTATPSVYFSVYRIWEYVNPDNDFKYSDEAFHIAKKICQKHKYTFKDENPFVLKNVAKKTNYSIIEKQRISEFNLKKGFKLFDEFDIDEKQGDRLLMIFKLPSWDKFKNLKGQ